ncbi:hypothetical protein ACW95P_03165 [Candidatus Mycoplasma pogonae]
MKNSSSTSKKILLIKKTSLFVLSTLPLFASLSTIVSATMQYSDGYSWWAKESSETTGDWIRKNNLSNFTNWQMQELENYPYDNTYGEWKTAIFISKLNDKMSLMRQMHKFMDEAVNTKSDFTPHFSKANNSGEIDRFAIDLSRVGNILLKDDFGTGVSPIDENNIDQTLIKLNASWSVLNGFSEELKQIFSKTSSETNNLTAQQKGVFYNKINEFKRFVEGLKIQPFTSTGQLNKNYINQWNQVLNKYKEIKNNFETEMYKVNNEMAKLKAFANEYEAKKKLRKYTATSDASLKRKFDESLEEPFRPDYASISLSRIKESETEIVNAYNALNGAEPTDWIDKTLEQLRTRVADYDKLSSESIKTLIQSIESIKTLARTRRWTSDTPENRKNLEDYITTYEARLKERNNEFNKLEEAFLKYRAKIGTIAYDQATNKSIEDEKVFKALEKILIDPGRTGEEAKTLWRPRNGLLNKSYHITYLKIRNAISTTQINNAIKEINDATAALNGEIADALKYYLNAIGRSKYDTATNQSQQNTIVFNTLNDILENAVTQPTQLTKTFSIGNNSIKKGKTNAEITEAATKIKQTRDDLNGSELGTKKEELKNKLNVEPLNELNSVTKETIIKAIDDANTKSLLDEIETKLIQLASDFSAANVKLTDLQNYKTASATELNYRLADESLKTAFDEKVTILKNKLDNAKKSSGTNIWNNDDFANIVKETNVASGSLNGTINKNAAFRKIDSLVKIADTTKQELKNQIEKNNKTEKVDNKASMEKLVTDLENANNKFVDLKVELKNIRI